MTAPSPILAELLERDRTQHAASYRGGLTNHLPMVLTALSRLGAGEERLRGYATTYADRLEPAAPWPRYQALAVEVARDGVDATVRARLPVIIPGLAGAALHGVIRLAYAVMSRVPEEVAAALAYAEDNAQPLELPVGRRQEADLSVLVERLIAARIERPGGQSITSRVATVFADERFRLVAADVAVDKSTLSQLSGLAARWYLAADEFSSLHALTGTHAVRVLRPFTVDTAAIDRALAQAALALFVICGSPPRSEARGMPRADDRELKARAIASADDHLAKLVVTCLDEEAAMEDQIYRIIATRAARRGDA